MVYFVEHSRRAVELIKENLESLGIRQGFRIIQQAASQAIPQLDAQGIRANVIFLDPPYRLESAYRTTLETLAKSNLAAPAQVIAEHEDRFDPGARFALFERTRKLDQGDATLSFYQAAPD